MPTRRISANVPRELLDAAMKASGKGITETLTEGLHLVCGRSAYEKAMALRGKTNLDLDLDLSRNRPVDS